MRSLKILAGFDVLKYMGIVMLLLSSILIPHRSFSLTVDEVGRELMSPPCNYLMTLETCKTGEAKELRKLVKEMIDRGMTKEEIKAYFVREYGEKVLGAPTKRGFNLLAYYLPYLIVIDALLVLSLVLIVWTRKKTGTVESVAISIDSEEDEAISDEIEEEIRSIDN